MKNKMLQNIIIPIILMALFSCKSYHNMSDLNYIQNNIIDSTEYEIYYTTDGTMYFFNTATGQFYTDSINK